MKIALAIFAIVIACAMGVALTRYRAQENATQAAPPAAARVPSAGASSEAPADSSFAVPVWHGEFVAQVRKKYRYLLEDVRLDGASRDALVRLLLEREVLADPDLGQGPALARLDDELRSLLHPADYAAYAQLRDSDAEQVELEEFSSGLSEYSPLDAAQRRALLEARLRHKQEYDIVRRDSGLEPEALLLAYRDAFLGEMRPLLDDRQYLALVSYETTEFDQRRESLRMR